MKKRRVTKFEAVSEFASGAQVPRFFFFFITLKPRVE